MRELEPRAAQPFTVLVGSPSDGPFTDAEMAAFEAAVERHCGSEDGFDATYPDLKEYRKWASFPSHITARAFAADVRSGTPPLVPSIFGLDFEPLPEKERRRNARIRRLALRIAARLRPSRAVAATLATLAIALAFKTP